MECTYPWYSNVVKLFALVYQHNWLRGTVQKQIPKANSESMDNYVQKTRRKKGQKD